MSDPRPPWRVIRVMDELGFKEYRGWVEEAIAQWHEVLKDPEDPQPVATMVANVSTCLPNVWILADRDGWLGMGCLVREVDDTLSAHGLMRRDPETGLPIAHAGSRPVMREMLKVIHSPL